MSGTSSNFTYLIPRISKHCETFTLLFKVASNIVGVFSSIPNLKTPAPLYCKTELQAKVLIDPGSCLTFCEGAG